MRAGQSVFLFAPLPPRRVTVTPRLLCQSSAGTEGTSLFTIYLILLRLCLALNGNDTKMEVGKGEEGDGRRIVVGPQRFREMMPKCRIREMFASSLFYAKYICVVSCAGGVALQRNFKKCLF